MDAAEEAMAGVVMTETMDATGLGLLAIEAASDTVNPHLGVISILTSHLAPTEVAAHPTAHLDPLRIPLMDASAAATTAVRRPHLGTAEKGDAVQTMVIETDPIIEMKHPAHKLPDEIKEHTTA